MANWKYQLGNALYELGKAREGDGADRHVVAIPNYEEARQIVDRLVGDKQVGDQSKVLLASVNFRLSFKFIFDHRFAEAVVAADKAVEYAQDDYSRIWPIGNKAHALMFLDRGQEALDLYRQHAAAVSGNRSWAEDILDDFRQFRAAAIVHPLMESVETLMRAALREKALQNKTN